MKLTKEQLELIKDLEHLDRRLEAVKTLKRLIDMYASLVHVAVQYDDQVLMQHILEVLTATAQTIALLEAEDETD